ncbi:MAG: hypothetical protein ACYC8T_39450, partial [Myxococcaceae bacterium]
AACKLADQLPKKPPSALPQESVNSPAPFDLGRVIDQVHFAFRQEGEAWTAGHSTYGVRVEGGVLELKPYHHPNGRLGGEETVEGAPVRFGAAVVRYGGRIVSAGKAAARIGEQGQLLLQKGEVVETLRNSRQGVEQTWRFETLPKGTAGLEVWVPVVEGRFAGATATGLHFQAGALMVSYGHGIWVDAVGRRSEVPARFEKGAVVLRVPNEVLAQSKFPAVLDPVIGPEFGMDAPVFGPAVNSQTSPAVAWNGTSYLVVWEDLRGGTGWSGWDIYGARVSATGAVQDAAGIAIAAAAGWQRFPALACDGADYLVVWQDQRTGTSKDIYGARVSAAGAVQDAQGIAIATAAIDRSLPESFPPAVAWDGTNYLVVWADERNGTTGNDIYGARLSAAGVVQDASGIAISTAAGEQSSPAVAWDGNDYLVVWQDARNFADDIYGARVSAAGAVQDASGIAISTAASDQISPAVAWDGTNYLVVWQDARNFASDIYGV